MSFFEKIKSFFVNNFFNLKWRCLGCGEEKFNDKYFCEECQKNLPYNNGYICFHCGRKTQCATNYCDTCKNMLTSIDKGRSVFIYAPPISDLIKKLKYGRRKYIAEVLSEYLFYEYGRNLFLSDYLAFVPMTEKAKRKRGFNQSELLAKNLSDRCGVPVFYGIEKVKETERQASLSAEDRKKNLKNAFKIVDKKAIKDKKILLIDDVTTTGATLEVLASLFKSKGAKTVDCLTVASVYKDNKDKKDKKIKKQKS